MYAMYSTNLTLENKKMILKTNVLYKVNPSIESEFSKYMYFFEEFLETPKNESDPIPKAFVVAHVLEVDQENGITSIVRVLKLVSVEQFSADIPDNLIPVTNLVTRTKTTEMIDKAETLHGTNIICLPEHYADSPIKTFSKLIKLFNNDIITIKTPEFIVDGMFESFIPSPDLIKRDYNANTTYAMGSIRIRPIIKTNSMCYIASRPVSIDLNNDIEISDIEYIHSF